MIRSALLISAGLLAALTFACVAVAPPPPPPPMAAAVVPKACNAVSFAAGVQVLASDYDPNSPGHDRAKPPPPGSMQNAIYQIALQNAFNLAPPVMQAQLCSLDGVYINGGACAASDPSCSSNSWGYRATSNKGLYIAVAAGLWSRIQPYTYHQYETELLDNIFHWNPLWPAPRPPRYLAANTAADNFDMTVLAVLAHELGHVLWYKVMNPDHPGQGYDPNMFCLANDGSNFFNGSWMTRVNPPNQWRYVGDRVRDMHKADPQISQIDAYLRAADTDDAVSALNMLYQPAYPWASYFGAISPDEDFVETFKFYVLTHANPGEIPGEGPLTSLPLRVFFVNGSSPPDANIPADFLSTGVGKPELARKINCILHSLH